MKKTVMITGVAGGIGRATAKVFADVGWHVVGIDRKEEQDLPGVEDFINADISKPEELERIFRKVENTVGHLHALVNNAAVQICKPLMDTSPEEWDTVMMNNLRSVFLAVKLAYPLLKENDGAIINVSSVHAVATSCNIAAYAASKGALLAFTRALALEFGSEGVRVNAVLPGTVDTKMLRDGLEREHVAGDEIEDLVRGLGEKHVMGRVGRPSEIGEAILFLAEGDRSSFMTGQSLVVDGGATARLSTE